MNAFVGVACTTPRGHVDDASQLLPLGVILKRVQHELFNLGSILATLRRMCTRSRRGWTDAEVERLEREMDRMNQDLPAAAIVRSPGGCRLNGRMCTCVAPSAAARNEIWWR
ncbi:MAG: ATP:cob(I)alamin adenosyltransferase [Ignavibacteriota bacterium]